MGAFVVDRLLERNPGVDPAIVEDVVCGVGMPQGLQAFNIGRIVSLLSEKLPQTVNGVTVSRYCASSLDAIRHAGNAIKAGEGDAYLAVGVEWVSRYNERSEAAGAADQNEKLQGNDGQPNVYIEMGADRGQRRQEIRGQPGRHGQVRPALAGTRRALAGGRLLRARNRAGRRSPTAPSSPRTTARAPPRPSRSSPNCRRPSAAAASPPATPARSTTAPPRSLLMSDTKAKELGLTPRARIVTAATWGNEPEYMGVAPIGAIKKALDRAGMSIDDVGAVELNEAFAAQVIPIMDECGIALEKLNTHGGAIALGHPFGMTGARIMSTLLNVMETDDHQVGLETMCVAGGQGEAMIVERV